MADLTPLATERAIRALTALLVPTHLDPAVLFANLLPSRGPHIGIELLHRGRHNELLRQLQVNIVRLHEGPVELQEANMLAVRTVDGITCEHLVALSVDRVI
eukprot:15477719-Alexandrium_andersonii.AAC.1